MINFRFHVVSLAAVFLALAVGMIVGSTVVDDFAISQLERDVRDFRNSNSELRAQTDALEDKVGAYEQFGRAVLPRFVGGRLSGRAVVLLVQDGARGEVLDAVNTVLVMSGAPKPARVRLSAGWTLADDESRGRLSAAAGIQTGDQKSVLEAAANALGARLASSGNPK
ncbi:MAG: copper transporter, partial [Actinomycetota bacterium]